VTSHPRHRSRHAAKLARSRELNPTGRRPRRAYATVASTRMHSHEVLHRQLARHRAIVTFHPCNHDLLVSPERVERSRAGLGNLPPVPPEKRCMSVANPPEAAGERSRFSGSRGG